MTFSPCFASSYPVRTRASFLLVNKARGGDSKESECHLHEHDCRCFAAAHFRRHVTVAYGGPSSDYPLQRLGPPKSKLLPPTPRKGPNAY